MASINRQTRSDFQFCIRNANNSQSLGVHTHFCGRCITDNEVDDSESVPTVSSVETGSE